MTLLIYIEVRNTHQLEDLTRTLNISTESIEIAQEDITVLSQRKRTQIQDEENDVKKNQGTLFNYFHLTEYRQ